MDNGVEPFEIIEREIAEVLADMRHGRDAASRLEGTVLIEIAVEPDHFVARLQQHRDHHGSDITQMSCHHYTHDRSSCSLHHYLSCVESLRESVRCAAFRASQPRQPHEGL